MGVSERLTFEDAAAPTLIAAEHRHRYRFAAAMAGGRRVLDLCCGSGYGSAILAETADTVHGVDNHGPTVNAAAARLPHLPNVSFEVGDALDVLRRSDCAERYDLIVCFEGLEHLAALREALQRLRELAGAGAAMILSVPNSRGLDEDNEFHVTDFTWEDALERIGSFPAAIAFTQYLAEGSVIAKAGIDRDSASSGRVELGDRHEPPYANHFLFCIGVDPAPLDAVLDLEATPLANRYLKNLELANAQLRRTNAQLARERMILDAALANPDRLAQPSHADSAAAVMVAKYERAIDRLAELEERVEALDADKKAWIERCLGAEQREAVLREALGLRGSQRLTRIVANRIRRRPSA